MAPTVLILLLRTVIPLNTKGTPISSAWRGVTDSPVLGESMKQHFKEMIAYCWGMFDKTLRPVDSDPVGIQFLDPRLQPIKLQPYRLNAPKLAFLKDTIQEWIRWIRDGIIRPSESPWGFPAVIVPKPQNKGWRMCVDLRKLNETTKHDSYQSPRNDDAYSARSNYNRVRKYQEGEWILGGSVPAGH